MTPIIEARGLTKRFGEVRALDGLDLVAESGRVTALLGPNGAGKTTFVSAVARLLRPDGGEIRVAGIDVCAEPHRVRKIIGLAGQFASVEPAMTGSENLQLVARLFGLDRRSARAAAADVLERLGLADAGDRLVRDYSGGMRRRLDLGASLAGRPRLLLLLDEPTTGLDPRARIELWEAIRSLVADDTDVLLTTQYLEEGRPARAPRRDYRPRTRDRSGNARRAQGSSRAQRDRGPAALRHRPRCRRGRAGEDRRRSPAH
jgi:ABC-2 type transport system ATP-binding protein